MYCTNCGTEVAEGSKFCSNCGTRLEVPAQPEVPAESMAAPAAEAAAAQEEAEVKRPSFAEFEWHVEDYPNREGIEKTEDVDFNWNASPDDIADVPRRAAKAAAAVKTPEASADVLRGEDLEKAVFGQMQQEKSPEELSAAERIDKFYTFNKKNEEFQKLINNEYQRVKSGNAIEHELFEADKLAQERFESRPELSSMESFLEREGIVKPYQPKEFQSDVLQKIEAQEAEKEAKRQEEEARLAAIEEARKEAEMKRKAAEEAALKAEEERKAAELARQQEEERLRAAEEARMRAEEEARLRAEEEARIRAEEEAELARRQEEEAELARIRAEEEARLRAEEEARLRAETEARIRAEEEARLKAEEEARLQAEADLRAAQEAAKIRAQQEARLAAEAEAQFRAEQERRQLESEEAQRRLEEKRRKLEEEANQAVAEEEIRKMLEQTARMREEEAAKIRAAVAGLRGGAGAAAAAQAAVESAEIKEAHQATKDQINEMAKARDAFFADMEPFEDTAEKEEEPVAPEPVIHHVTGRETMLSASDDLAKTRVIDKAAIIAGLNEPTRIASMPVEPAPVDDDDFFRSLEEASADPFIEELPDIDEVQEFVDAEEALPAEAVEETMEEAAPVSDLDDLLSQFESVNDIAAEEIPAEENPGLEDTVLMTGEDTADQFAGNEFDSYGNEEAERFRSQQETEEASFDDGIDTDNVETAAPLTKKEQKRLEKEKAREAKAAKKREKKEQEETEDEEESGGKGRIVLKVILVLLIIILVIEVAGMGIRFLAPNSGAAEFIDNQLNKVIHMITGEDDSVEYTVETRTDETTAPADDATADPSADQNAADDASGNN